MVSWKITAFSGESKKIFPNNTLLRLYKYRAGNDFRFFWTKKVYNVFEILKIDYKTEIFDGDSYRIIIFRVKDFLDVSHSHYNSQNEYYKMQKTKDFLRDLQQNLLVKCFTDYP